MKRHKKRIFVVYIFSLWLIPYSCVSGDFLAMDDLKFVQDTGIRKHLRIDGFYLPDSINSPDYGENGYIIYEDGSIINAYAYYLRNVLDGPYPAKSIYSLSRDNGVYGIRGDTITANIYRCESWLHKNIKRMARFEAKIIDSTHFNKYITEYYILDTMKTGERVIEQPYHFVQFDTLPPSSKMFIKEREVLWDDKLEYLKFMNSNGKKIKHKKE